jgi:hypothetical protein
MGCRKRTGRGCGREKNAVYEAGVYVKVDMPSPAEELHVQSEN